MRRLSAMLTALAVLGGITLPATPSHASDPEWAALASFGLPGVGQAINGDYAEGVTHTGLYLLLVSQAIRYSDRKDYIEYDKREDTTENTLRINRTTIIADMYNSAALDLQFYSAFGAYRDARMQHENRPNYWTTVPHESLTDLNLAPFKWEFLSRLTTLAPLAIPLYLVFTPASKDQLIYSREDGISREELAARFFVQHNLVAVGEEAFFRGFLNNALSDSMGEFWGLVTSSAIFGLGHSGQGAQATAIGAALFGGYLGWLQQRNDYAIGQGVAIHFWWNFLASLSLLRERDNPSSTAQVIPITLNLRF